MKLKEKLIRLFYIIPFLVFLYLITSNLEILWETSSLGIPYIVMFVVPALVFLYQAIVNSIVGWWLVMGLYLLFLAIWVIGLIEAYDMVGAKHELSTYLTWWFFVIAYLGVGFLYFKFRPIRNNN